MSNASDFNPLIEDTHTHGDTINNVQAALDFIADSLVAVERDTGLSEATAHGANRLIRRCMSAASSLVTGETCKFASLAKSARFAN